MQSGANRSSLFMFGFYVVPSKRSGDGISLCHALPVLTLDYFQEQGMKETD